MDPAYKSGAWLTVMPSFLYNTELSAQDFRDNVRWRLGLEPCRLPTHYDRCGAPFLEEHACRYKVGELVNLQHNLLTDKWRGLCAKSLTKTDVYDEPIIHTGNHLKEEGARQSK